MKRTLSGGGGVPLPLKVISLKKSTVGAFAVSSRVLNQIKNGKIILE